MTVSGHSLVSDQSANWNELITWTDRRTDRQLQ